MQATQSKMYIKQDIISHSKGNKYASQGDLVTVHGNIPVKDGELALCEKSGERFHVPADMLSVEFVAREVIINKRKK